MTWLLDVTIRTSFLLACGLAAAALLKGQSAALRHRVLAISLAGAAAIPALGPMAPSWTVPFFTAGVPVLGNVGAGAVELGIQFDFGEGGSGAHVEKGSGVIFRPGLSGKSLPTPSLLWPLWIAGVAGSLSLLVVGLARLAWLARRSHRLVDGPWSSVAAEVARQYGLRRPVRLLRGDHPALPVTWGFRRPTVMVPSAAAEWGIDRIRIVLAHELAHVRRSDWAVQMGALAIRSLYWFNPLVWLVCSRLARESEHACDDAVLRQGIDGPTYARHLLELARTLTHKRRVWKPAPAIVRTSSLERRISAMLRADVNRAPVARAWSIAAALVILAIALPVAGFQAFAQSFATLSGSVFDPHGGLVPGATLILSNRQGQSRYEVRSSPSGQFEFVGLPPGDYVLEAAAPGFKSFRDTVTMSGANLRRDVRLEMGSVEESITVAAGAEGRPRVSAISEDFELRRRRIIDECRASAGAGGSLAGGTIRPPQKLKDVRPTYLVSLSQAGIGGVVELEALIGTDGSVKDLRAIDPAAHPALVAAAIEAVTEWQFDPTLLNCTPIDVTMTASIVFRPATPAR